MGRPTFLIDQRRLRSLREENNMTQLDLARAAAQVLNRSVASSDSSLLRHYQKIENQERTSPKMAEALAQALKVTAPVLQGLESPEPASYLDHIRKLMEQQLATGNHPKLQHMFNELAKDHPDEAMNFLAEDIAERIEDVQLIRDPAKVRQLVELTGLEQTDLLAPANVKGHWFISFTFGGTTKAEMAIGASDVGFRVGEILIENLRFTSNDTVVRMWRDKPWYRIEVEHPRIRRSTRIDFTRCHPDGKGLRWIDSSWRDDLIMDFGIKRAAYSHADFVTDFSGKTAPGDLNRLCLVVDEFYGSGGKAVRRMVVHGHFNEIPESVKQSWAYYHETRHLMANSMNLWLQRALMPHLAKQVATREGSTWRIRAEDLFSVELRLATPRDNLGLSPDKPYYRISLREETESKKFAVIPVRNKYYVDLASNISCWIAKGEWPTCDEPVPDFEPITESETD